MTMGDKIKYYRQQLHLTQDELGEKLGVQKSAIRKYEKGEVENIKRSSIKTMADLFGITPCELMCFEEEKVSDEQINQWDMKHNADGKLSKEVSLIEQIQHQYGKDAVKLLEFFTQLNKLGQEKALENISDLAALAKYTDSKKTEYKNA